MSETASGSRAGSRVGRYLLKQQLGRGTTGVVYEALDTHKDRTAALKLLAPALGRNPAFREWLQREALVVGRVQEPHVVPVRDFGELDGQAFIDMPLVPGTDLAALLRRHGVLPAYRAVNIVWQAAAGLDAAHAAGVIHRGLNPRNILLTADDFIYLVDFGLAGAPGADACDAENAGARWKYAAPELFSGGDFGPSVDVYALACVLYQCLTGSPPYRADSRDMLANAHLNRAIPRPSLAGAKIPAAFDDVVAKGMAKDPQERYASAAELATAAYQALSAPDQHRTLHIYESSQQSTPPLIDRSSPSAPQPGSAEAVPAEAPPASVAPADPPARPAAATSEPQPAARPAPEPQPVSTAGDDWLSTARQAPLHQDPAKRKLLLRVGAALAVVVGLIIWLTNRSGSEDVTADADTSGPAAGASQPTSTMSAADAQARLLKLLPPGYPQGTCTSTTPSAGALAEVTCGRNVDVDGPPTATYSLFPDASAQRRSFDNTVRTTNVVTCPGRIQSPGAWHRTASPEKTAGMLLCGTRQGSAVLVWTNESELMIGSVGTERNTPTLEQFYTWWSSHS
ncbi:protein kinase domain-containing protein [Mycolicibacter minnesotensis]